MAAHIDECCTVRADVIRRRIECLLALRRGDFADVGPWGADVLDRLAAFALRGKLVRGSLVLLGAELGGTQPTETSHDLAAALELFHSSILVHDDIIDRDVLRRGAPTVHAAYASRLRAEGAAHDEHHGAALALCAGDAGFFLVFAVLADADMSAATRHALLRLWSREFALVAFAEMDDVYLSTCAGPAAEADILRCYRYKTARYTFCLPLATGLTLAGAPPALMDAVEQIALRLGLVFQLKDDELGLFGCETETGKPVGADIVQNKKTLYHHCLLTQTEPDVRARLAALFGKADLTAEDTVYVQRMAEESGVKARVAAMAAGYGREAEELISRLAVPEAARKALQSLAAAGLAREK